MESFKIACATDDGSHFVGCHFGDAKHYDIYEVSPDKISFLRRIDNTTEEEVDEVHADPRKAKGITEILKREDIRVATTKVFGPNIMRIKSKFVCVLSGTEEIKIGLEKIRQNFSRVIEEWEKGPDRDFLDFRKVELS
jgi:predicted Fe-Mo cluster-binding NifX family protein